MTIATDAARPGGRVLLDTRGREIARFEEGERDGRPTANHFSLSVAPEDAVATVVAELAGWSVAVDEPFGRLLIDAGGRPRRHGRTLARDLARDPAPREWLEPPHAAGPAPHARRPAGDGPRARLLRRLPARAPGLRQHPVARPAGDRARRDHLRPPDGPAAPVQRADRG